MRIDAHCTLVWMVWILQYGSQRFAAVRSGSQRFAAVRSGSQRFAAVCSVNGTLVLIQ